MIAVVTGGSSGIGLEIANYFLLNNYEVVTIGRSEDNCYKRDLTVDHGNLINWQCDVLINNAGAQYLSQAVDYPMDEWRKQMEMMTAYFDLSRQAYLHGCKRIINIASDAGLRGTRGCIGYSVAKAAIIHMTKCLSNEWANTGCTINCICPGFIETDMLNGAFCDDQHRQQITELIPARRIGNTIDIIPAIQYLLDAEYVTGSVLTVDGGWSAR